MGRKSKFKIFYGRGAVHHLCIFMTDKNGNLFMSREQLIKCIMAHDGGFSTASFALHDKDVYDAEAVYQHGEKNHKTYIETLQVLSFAKGLEKDETQESGFVYDAELSKKAQEYADEQFPAITMGTPKPAHWHVILTFSTNRGADEIARWFKGLNGKTLEPNWNELKKGRGAAESAWLYLIHHNHPKKAQYDKTDVWASFDYVNGIEEQIRLMQAHEKYHIDADSFNDVIEEVMHGLPLKDAMARVSGARYMQRESLFKNARRWYVENESPMPLFREVFYVDSEGMDSDHGKGGLGKSACAKAFAKQLAREFGADVSKNINDLQDFIFIAGDADVFLQEYDGQPVLLIDEINGVDFKRACKGVNGVKALLSPFPERKNLNKKYGSVVCSAKYIVINGIQSFEAFKKSLAEGSKINGVQQDSEESVKEQFDRRFWGHIHIIDASQTEYWVNRGLFDNTPEQNVMEMIARVNVSFQRIASQTTGGAQAQIEGRVLRPLLEEVAHSQETHAKDNKIDNPDDLPADLLAMGELVIIDDDKDADAPFNDPHNSEHVYEKINSLGLILPYSDKKRCLEFIQRAIDYKFFRAPFDDVVKQEDRRIIFMSLGAIDKMSGGR